MKRPDYLKSGELTRLIPVSSKTERKAVSITGAILTAVDEFADSLLGSLGAPTGKRSKVEVWVEPVFKDDKLKSPKLDRPDALIIVNNNRREWRALVEAKTKGEDLSTNQIECYLDIAKEKGIDAVITISNQFVATPVQSPCNVSKVKLKRVCLYHWSWSYLQTEAKIQLSKCAVSDPDQAYMLEEYVRYLDHDSSGVSEFQQMGSSWGDVCKLYFSKSKLDKKSDTAQEVVSDWDELTRCTALLMSRNLDTNVTIYLTPTERKCPDTRLNRMQSIFIDSGILESQLVVPGAASMITIEADLGSRSVKVAMSVDSPKDKKRATATVTWLIRQLSNTDAKDVQVIARWPGRIQDTFGELGALRQNPEILVEERKGYMPRGFEVKIVSDLGGKFTQKRNFVKEFTNLVNNFYVEVGQHIIPWQAPPPKPKSQVVTIEDESENGINIESSSFVSK